VIAEAIDAADSVVRALLVWIVLAAAVLTAALFAVVAAGWAVWRMLSGAWAAAAPRADSLAPLAAEQPTADPESPRAAERNPATPHRTVPAWARTDEEAA
jgi:hypothetical protein